MARPRNGGQAAETEAPAEPEAEIVQEQVETEEEAAAKRAKAEERAAALKSVPDDAEPPTERETDAGTAFSRERLLAESEALLGQPRHVAAGALYGNPNQYLTVADANAEIERWLATQVTPVKG